MWPSMDVPLAKEMDGGAFARKWGWETFRWMRAREYLQDAKVRARATMGGQRTRAARSKIYLWHSDRIVYCVSLSDRVADGCGSCLFHSFLLGFSIVATVSFASNRKLSTF